MRTIPGFRLDDRTGLSAVVLLASLSRLSHLIGYLTGRMSELYYWPVLAAERFETAAAAIVSGTGGTSLFVYASPLYRFLLLPFYLTGTDRIGLFVFQSILGVLTAVLLYLIARRVGASIMASVAVCAIWILYAPATFFELTMLPISMVTFLTMLLVWMAASGRLDRRSGAAVAGLIIAFAAGLRPPMILLGAWPLLHWLRRRNFSRLLICLSLFLLPMLFLAWQQHRAGGGFTPFPRAAGLNLVLGHADGVTGYGPPVESEGLIETSSEDIHQVAARIAAERGYTDPAEADAYWISTALSWIAAHPVEETRLLMVKLGGFLGTQPFDTYYDMGRLGRFNPGIAAHFVPRLLPVVIFLAGLFHFLRRKNGYRWLVLLPVVISAASSLLFVHCERFSLPVLPLMLAVGAAGVTAAAKTFGESVSRAVLPSILGLALLIPALIWPVPTVPEGMYVYSLGIRAYGMRDYELSLELMERAGVLCPEGSVLFVESHRQAAVIGDALGYHERAEEHRRILDEYVR